MAFEAVEKFRTEWQPAALLVMRVVFGYAFLLHGLMKFGVLDGAFKMPGGLMLWAGLIEVIGGALIMLGVFTSWVAFLASGEVAVAYWMAHASNALWWNPLANKGEPALLFCFAFLLLFFLGGGKYSVERLWQK